MENKRNKKLALTVGALALALLLTGSLAWQDLSQHKTSNFQTASLEHNVILVENFDEVENWMKGEVIQKEVAVRNGQDHDPVGLIYEDAYIRLQFRQFMEIGTRDYEYSEIRYMIDEAGNFVRFDTQDEAEAYLDTLDTKGLVADVPEGGRIQNVKGYFDDKAYFYIATQAHDANGQYGKFLILDVVDGEMEPLVSGEVDYADSALNENDHNKQPEANGEHNYTVKKWDGVVTAYDAYVEWILGADVMTKAEWIASGQEPVSKWIIDTESSEGWVYWGQALSHSQSASIPNTMTSNFLEAVKLIKQPIGNANYQINVFLDAVSVTDLNKWTDADESILDMLISIEGVESVWAQLESAVNNAELLDLDAYTSDSQFALQNAIDNAKTVLNSETSTIANLSDALKALETALKNLEVKPVSKGKDIEGVVAGGKLTFANREYTVLHIDEENKQALILSNQLTAADFSAMGVITDKNGNAFKYQQTIATYGNGYVGSKLEQVDNAYYESFVKGSTDEKYVKPVSWSEEIGVSGWYMRSDGPTLVDEALGTKKAFSLSVSDIICLSVSASDLTSTNHYWLRSPGDRTSAAAAIDATRGSISSTSVTDASLVARPALWIAID